MPGYINWPKKKLGCNNVFVLGSSICLRLLDPKVPNYEVRLRVLLSLLFLAVLTPICLMSA